MRCSCGFSLVEAIIATALLALVLCGLAYLLAIGVDNNLTARRQTASTTLAQQKLEQLRSLKWAYDTAGAPITDSALAPSPVGSLEQDTAGFVEFLDTEGVVLAVSGPVPSAAAYVRRWAIEITGANTLVLQVLVKTARGRTQSVTLVGAKARKAP